MGLCGQHEQVRALLLARQILDEVFGYQQRYSDPEDLRSQTNETSSEETTGKIHEAIKP